MPDQDDLGYWTDLGFVSCTIDQWKKLPNQATWGRDTFRITFHGDLDLVESYIWIRQEFPLGVVTPSLRYYPKIEPQILQIPIPKDFKDNNNEIRSIVCRQATRYRRRMGWHSYPPISIKIEELSGF